MDSKYPAGSVVWAKLEGGRWWPGQVAAESDCEEVLKTVRKPPLAVVKFFDEDFFHIVNNSQHIYAYECEKKEEFLKRGKDLKLGGKDNFSLRVKFETDVMKAESLCESSVANSLSPKTPDNTKSSKMFNRCSYMKMTEAERFDYSSPVQEERKTSYEPYLRKSDELGMPRIRKQPATPKSDTSDYTCDTCGFQTARLDNIIRHHRSHSDPYRFHPAKESEPVCVFEKLNTMKYRKKNSQGISKSDSKAKKNKTPRKRLIDKSFFLHRKVNFATTPKKRKLKNNESTDDKAHSTPKRRRVKLKEKNPDKVPFSNPFEEDELEEERKLQEQEAERQQKEKDEEKLANPDSLADDDEKEESLEELEELPKPVVVAWEDFIKDTKLNSKENVGKSNSVDLDTSQQNEEKLTPHVEPIKVNAAVDDPSDLRPSPDDSNKSLDNDKAVDEKHNVKSFESEHSDDDEPMEICDDVNDKSPAIKVVEFQSMDAKSPTTSQEEMSEDLDMKSTSKGKDESDDEMETMVLPVSEASPKCPIKGKSSLDNDKNSKLYESDSKKMDECSNACEKPVTVAEAKKLDSMEMNISDEAANEDALLEDNTPSTKENVESDDDESSGPADHRIIEEHSSDSDSTNDSLILETSDPQSTTINDASIASVSSIQEASSNKSPANDVQEVPTDFSRQEDYEGTNDFTVHESSDAPHVSLDKEMPEVAKFTPISKAAKEEDSSSQEVPHPAREPLTAEKPKRSFESFIRTQINVPDVESHNFSSSPVVQEPPEVEVAAAPPVIVAIPVSSVVHAATEEVPLPSDPGSKLDERVPSPKPQAAIVVSAKLMASNPEIAVKEFEEVQEEMEVEEFGEPIPTEENIIVEMPGEITVQEVPMHAEEICGAEIVLADNDMSTCEIVVSDAPLHSSEIVVGDEIEVQEIEIQSVVDDGIQPNEIVIGEEIIMQPLEIPLVSEPSGVADVIHNSKQHLSHGTAAAGSSLLLPANQLPSECIASNLVFHTVGEPLSTVTYTTGTLAPRQVILTTTDQRQTQAAKEFPTTLSAERCSLIASQMATLGKPHYINAIASEAVVQDQVNILASDNSHEKQIVYSIQQDYHSDSSTSLTRSSEVSAASTDFIIHQ